MSGLFVRPPNDLSDPYKDQGTQMPDDLHAKISFEEEAAEAFNRLICEFCLRGVVSEPTSPTHISYAQIVDGHILIMGGGGGRELYLERTMGPGLALMSPFWLTWHTCPEAVLERAVSLELASRLTAASNTIPSFVAGAYSFFSQRQANEALIDSWIVCEQLLDRLWQDYRSAVRDSRRRERLADTRTYSAAVRLEVLRTARVLSEQLYNALNRAREHRNNLAHRARSSFEAVSECMMAMKLMLEEVCGQEVDSPQAARGVNW